MHVQVVTCTVQFILSFSNISPSYELRHVGYLYDCWLASAMCPPATAGAAGWLPGIRNMIRIGLIPVCQINQPPQSPLGWLIIRRTWSTSARPPYSKVNNVFCLSLLGLLDSSYGSIPARARSDRNVLGGSHGLPPHSSMYRYTNSGRSSLRPFYSSFSVNDLNSPEKF